MNDGILHTLIPLAEFKAVLGIDDREDCLSRYCLVTATYTIEHYCRRRFLLKKHTDYLTFTGDYLFSLREYPVRKVLSIHVDDEPRRRAAGYRRSIGNLLYCRVSTPQCNCWFEDSPQSGGVFDPASNKGRVFGAASLVNPEHYYCLPDEGIFEDLPFSLMLRPPFRLPREEGAIRVRYMAGYSADGVPADLGAACLELAAWNMSRYRGKRIGLTGNVRGSGKDGEHLETAMPENVRGLLEPYVRRVI